MRGSWQHWANPKGRLDHVRPAPELILSKIIEGRLAMLQPDVDNLAKFVLDSLNGVLFNDDSRVVTLLVTKGWSRDSSSFGSTAIRIHAIENSYTYVL